MQSLDWTTVRQLDWTPIYAKPWSNGRCGALTDRTSTRKCWSIVYGCKASVVHAVEDTLSQARASSNPDQLNAVSKSGQSEPSTGPTFCLNRTTERSVAAHRRRPVRQSSSGSKSMHADTHAEYAMQSYWCTARCTARRRAHRCEPSTMQSHGQSLDWEAAYDADRCKARCRVFINQTTNQTIKSSHSLCYFDRLPCRHRCCYHYSVQLFRPAVSTDYSVSTILFYCAGSVLL